MNAAPLSPTDVDRVRIRRLDGAEATARAGELAEVLIDCVDGGASVSFLHPLARADALAFWHDVAADVAEGSRVLLVAEDASGHLLGTVQMILSLPPNQPHRADVAKMLVHRRARRRGIARQLMEALDDAARAERRTVLVLDTVTDGDAERLYARAGWQRVGVVPKFALMPDGAFCATTYFYKHL